MIEWVKMNSRVYKAVCPTNKNIYMRTAPRFRMKGFSCELWSLDHMDFYGDEALPLIATTARNMKESQQAIIDEVKTYCAKMLTWLSRQSTFKKEKRIYAPFDDDIFLLVSRDGISNRYIGVFHSAWLENVEEGGLVYVSATAKNSKECCARLVKTCQTFFQEIRAWVEE